MAQHTRAFKSKLMISDGDVIRCAQLMQRQHGEDARIFAAMRADAMLEKGDFEGQRLWMRVVQALVELERLEPVGLTH
jgi:hypothetical protein